MRLTILTVGSRGDVQPFLALGRVLADAGHAVDVATHPRFEPLAARVGLSFTPLAEGRISEGPQTEEGRRWLEGSGRRAPSWVGYLQDARTVARHRLADALRACRDADAIIASDLATLLGWQMAEHFDRPLVRAGLNLPVVTRGWHSPAANAVRQGLWWTARPWLDGVRRDVGLPSLPGSDPVVDLHRRRTLTLRAYSPAVGAVPAPGRDWIHVTGYWFLDQRLDPVASPALDAFIAAGPRPVCIDFGSMLDDDPDRTTELAIAALGRTGHRGVLIRGRYRRGSAGLPATIFAVDAVPHDWLFARCAAVVHHAAAGTTAAALRAGIPSVPVPHMPDQARWARRIHRLGAAAAPIPRSRLTADALAAGIAAVTGDPTFGARAASLSAQVRAQNGTARALEILERELDQPARAGRLRVAV
jgi:UDP:flavonoid glycosyltransferase YjiC (YdhE family)